jgi:hypothetical protein
MVDNPMPLAPIPNISKAWLWRVSITGLFHWLSVRCTHAPWTDRNRKADCSLAWEVNARALQRYMFFMNIVILVNYAKSENPSSS